MALLNWPDFLERVDHNWALALELAEDLLQALDLRVGRLEEALRAGEQKPIEQAAHALRGLLSPYGPVELLAVVKELEEKARAQALDLRLMPKAISDLIATFKGEVAAEISKLKKDIEQMPV